MKKMLNNIFESVDFNLILMQSKNVTVFLIYKLAFYGVFYIIAFGILLCTKI